MQTIYSIQKDNFTQYEVQPASTLPRDIEIVKSMQRPNVAADDVTLFCDEEFTTPKLAWQHLGVNLPNNSEEDVYKKLRKELQFILDEGKTPRALKVYKNPKGTPPIFERHGLEDLEDGI